MEKPKITPGPWEIGRGQTIFHHADGPETKGYRPRLATVSEWRNSGGGEPTEEAAANAQAISAVPEMIDALMEAYKGQGDPLSHSLSVAQVNQIKSALKKAGVTI